jgi:hypothetical protein
MLVAVVRNNHFSSGSRTDPGRLARLTARKAATIEPTVQEPMIKVTALKSRPHSNSTVLVSMRMSFQYL